MGTWKYGGTTILFAVAVGSFDPACPCIDITARASHTSHMTTETCLNVVRRDNVFCYDLEYGTSECKTWDAGLKPDCDGSRPEKYCKEAWCYVNATTCRASEKIYVQSSWFKGLYYSYSTCDSHETPWRNSEISQKLQGKVVKIAYPMSYFPNFYRKDAEGNPITSYDGDKVNGTGDYLGIYPEYWKMLEEAGGFTSKPQFVSLGSRAIQSSSWTACVQDVMNGIVDICPGDFWNTPERYSMIPFTVPVYTTKYFVMIKTPKPSNDFRSTAFKVLAPLTTDLWISVILVTIGVGFLRAVIFMTTVTDDEDGEALQKPLPLRFFHRLWADTWLTISQLVNPLAEGDEDVGKSPALKMINLGWGVFLFFALAVYSANLTAFMVKRDLKMPIKSINDCVTVRCTLCIDQTKVSAMQDIVAQKINYKEYTKQSEAILGLTNGECDAALAEERYYRMRDELHHEELVFTGQAVLSYFVGWPATSEVRSTISYLMNKIEGSADSPVYKEIEGRYKPSMKHDPFRDPVAQPEGQDSEQFGIDSMVGVLIMSLSLLGFSIVLAILRIVFLKIKARRGKVEECNENTKEGANEEGAKSTGDLRMFERVNVTAHERLDWVLPCEPTPSGTMDV